MADEKSTVITLVAHERGFHNGQMVEPKTEFPFNTVGKEGKPRKLPKWAVKKGDPLPHKPELKNGDLRPVAAQAASKGKRDKLSEDLAG